MRQRACNVVEQQVGLVETPWAKFSVRYRPPPQSHICARQRVAAEAVLHHEVRQRFGQGAVLLIFEPGNHVSPWVGI